MIPNYPFVQRQLPDARKTQARLQQCPGLLQGPSIVFSLPTGQYTQPLPLPSDSPVRTRGEIATRIISSARELGLETYAIYTSGDDSHAVQADHAIKLDSAASFMNIDSLAKICKEHQIDAVHPGYGFLSESADLSRRMWYEANVAVVGPGWGILEKTGDKLKARQLAEECG